MSQFSSNRLLLTTTRTPTEVSEGKREERTKHENTRQNAWLLVKGTVQQTNYKLKIPEIKRFKYLGSVFIEDEKWETEIRRCLRITKDALQNLSNVL